MAYHDEPMTDEEMADRDRSLGNDHPVVSGVGVFYKTRDGRKAYVKKISGHPLDAYPCKGHIILTDTRGNPTQNQTMMWAMSGRVSASGPRPNDLVSLWSK